VFAEPRSRNGRIASLIGLIAAGVAFTISGIIVLIMVISGSGSSRGRPF
jgi:hypothetical protein